MSQESHKITICGKCKLDTCGKCEIKVFGKCDTVGCKNKGNLVVIEHGVIDSVEDYTAVCKKCEEKLKKAIQSTENKKDLLRVKSCKNPKAESI